MATNLIVVTCGMCGQPFEAEAPAPRPFPIGVPRHGALGPRGEPPTPTPEGICRGSGLPPMMFESRERWEARWRRLFDEAPLPAMLDGADVPFA